jgi:hypothetical protein
VLGPDLWNGTAAQVENFKNTTSATYPLLLNSGMGNPGNENLYVPYETWDNYAVINKQGVLRYLASKRWPHGSRYHLDEIRGCVDSLVSMPAVDVGGGLTAGRFTLNAAPNPFRAATAIELANPSTVALEGRVTVHDLAGRRIATPWSGMAAPGVTRLSWDGRGEAGARMGPGVYLIRAEVGGVRLTRRVVIVR